MSNYDPHQALSNIGAPTQIFCAYCQGANDPSVTTCRWCGKAIQIYISGPLRASTETHTQANSDERPVKMEADPSERLNPLWIVAGVGIIALCLLGVLASTLNSKFGVVKAESAAPSANERAYIQQSSDWLDLYRKDLSKLNELNTGSQRFNDQWKRDTSDLAAQIETTDNEVRKYKPLPQFSAMQEKWLRVVDHLDMATGLITRGANSYDDELIKRATDEINAANDTISDIATDLKSMTQQ